jgi:hypothetical protein
MSTGGKVCVETASEIEKLSPPSEKRNNYTTAPGETVLATSNSDKFHSVTPSCEKWQLVFLVVSFSASSIPAWRAAKLEPTDALREL